MRAFVKEDVGQGDITTSLLIPSETSVEAEVVVKESCIIAGIEEALTLLKSFGLQAEALVKDGDKVKEKTRILRAVGNARTLLSVERTLLNILSRMSGIATFTHKLVKKVRDAGYKVKIACTRKVAPGLSYFDKKAVKIGGGDTHRLHLDDLILIKDNHLAIIGNVEKVVSKLKAEVSFSKKLEVEVSTARDAVKAAESGADIVMLDNFSPKEIRKAISLLEKEGLRETVLIEASGGINEKNILKFASTGVNILSLGEITDSVKAVDISLEVVNVKKTDV